MFGVLEEDSCGGHSSLGAGSRFMGKCSRRCGKHPGSWPNLN
jgi:hypothetical protein